MRRGRNIGGDAVSDRGSRIQGQPLDHEMARLEALCASHMPACRCPDCKALNALRARKEPPK